MNLVAELVTGLVNDPQYKQFIKECLKELREESVEGMNEEISEIEAMKILAIKGRMPSAKTMLRYRSQKINALKYLPGRPVTYVRKDVYEFRDKNFVVQRNNFNQ